MSEFTAPNGAGVFVTPPDMTVANDDLDYFTPIDAIFPTIIAPASVVARNDHALITFSHLAIQAVYFTGVFFPVWSNIVVPALQIHIYWCAVAPVVVGDVKWAAAIERENAGGVYDVDVDSFGVESNTPSTTQAVNGQLTKTSMSVSYNGATPGDPYRLRVRRLAGDLFDTMVGAAQLLRVVVEKV